jgi:hypothetical protein
MVFLPGTFFAVSSYQSCLFDDATILNHIDCFLDDVLQLVRRRRKGTRFQLRLDLCGRDCGLHGYHPRTLVFFRIVSAPKSLEDGRGKAVNILTDTNVSCPIVNLLMEVALMGLVSNVTGS